LVVNGQLAKELNEEEKFLQASLILKHRKESRASDQQEFLPTLPSATKLSTNHSSTQKPFFPTRADVPSIITQEDIEATTNEIVTEPFTLLQTTTTTLSPSEITTYTFSIETRKPQTQQTTFTTPKVPTRVFTRPLPELPRSRNQSRRKLNTIFNIRNIIKQTNKQSASLLGEDSFENPNRFQGRSRTRSRTLTPKKQVQSDLGTGTLKEEVFTPSNRPAPRVPLAQTDPVAREPVKFQQPPVEEDNTIPDYEYEYYYEYLDEGHNKPNPEYDLVPLAKKVKILESGEAQCFDVGVFPHPFSCKMFINCYRNPGTGIQGSIYQCPSYLAFDPIGGRCNWVNEIVCSTPTR